MLGTRGWKLESTTCEAEEAVKVQGQGQYLWGKTESRAGNEKCGQSKGVGFNEKYKPVGGKP